MSVDQLRQAIPTLAAEVPAGRHNRTNFERKIQERLLRAMHAFLERGGEASAIDLWSWLKKIPTQHYHLKEWGAFSVDYFSSHPELRHEIQAMVLDEQKGHGCHFANFRLSQMAAGFVLTDSDLAFHLESLVLREHNLIGFADHWRDVVEWALLNPERFAVAERVARAQAETRPELQAIVTEIESRPSPAWEREEEQRQRRWELKERRRSESRHRHYAEAREAIRCGQHLSAVDTIAAAYLGLFSEVSEMDDPVNRVEWLVGPNNVEAALQGLSAACQRKDLPAPRADSQPRSRRE